MAIRPAMPRKVGTQQLSSIRLATLHAKQVGKHQPMQPSSKKKIKQIAFTLYIIRFVDYIVLLV